MGLFSIIKEVVDEQDLKHKLLPYIQKTLKVELYDIGKGSRGVAFVSTNDDKYVYKFTDDATEFETGKYLLNKTTKHIVTVYDVATLHSKLFADIFVEFSNTDKKQMFDYYFLKVDKVEATDETSNYLNTIGTIFERALQDMKTNGSSFKSDMLSGRIEQLKSMGHHMDNFKYYAKKFNSTMPYDETMNIIQQYIELLQELKKLNIVALDFNLLTGLNLGFKDKTLMLYDIGHSYSPSGANINPAPYTFDIDS